MPISTNQLTTWGTASLFYDLNGNMTSDGTHSYTWDARNRLSQMDLGNTASFTYDSFGRRATKSNVGTGTTFLYDGANPVQEVIGGTNTANSLSGGIDEVFQRTDSAGARSFLTDALGTTLALTDSNGAAQTSYTFEPFGNTSTSGSGTTNSFAYTGRELHAGNLYYYRARYYSPTLQRFISEDPIGFSEGDTNLYAYVFGYTNSRPMKSIWVERFQRMLQQRTEDAVTSEFQMLEKRIARIESQNRRLKWLAVVLAGLTLTSAAWAQTAKDPVVRAQKFELRDEGGRVRAELAILNGEAGLRFFDRNGVGQALLSGDSFTIFEKGGDILASFAKNGLQFEDGHEKTFVALTAHDKDQMGKLRLNDYRTGTFIVVTAQDLAKLKAKGQ